MTNILWIFISTAILPNCLCSWQDQNLGKITWYNAVNTQDSLKKALNSKFDTLEADVFIGTLESTYKTQHNIPVMGEPSDLKSDLSLQQFLMMVTKHNIDHPKKAKAVQLDFRSNEALAASVDILKNEWIIFPLIIKAEILEGPGGHDKYSPMNAEEYYKSIEEVPKAMISLGWTTYWERNTTEYYSQDEALDMMKTLRKYHKNITDTNCPGRPINFSVRATFAGHFLSVPSIAQLTYYCRKVINTLTIWSCDNDEVNVKELHEFIKFFNKDYQKVLLNVPEELRDQLDLIRSKSRANSLAQFSNPNLAAITFVFIFMKLSFVLDLAFYLIL